jgi:hypothetical protein
MEYIWIQQENSNRSKRYEGKNSLAEDGTLLKSNSLCMFASR